MLTKVHVDITVQSPNGDKCQCNTFIVSSADNEVEGQRAVSLDGTSASEGKPSRLRLTSDRVFPACRQPAAAFV